MIKHHRRNPSKSLLNLTLADVASVYSGKAGRCMCGCAGNYRLSSHVDRVAEGRRRGYPVKPTDINDAQVRKVIKILQNATDVEEFDDGFSVDIDGRRYAAYIR